MAKNDVTGRVPLPLLASGPSGQGFPKTWLFDVDGTLTPPRGDMDPAFRSWMARFVATREVCLVTGGTWERIERQCGPALARAFRAAYLCNGNEARVQGEVAYSRRLHVPPALQRELDELMRQPLPLTGQAPVLEQRPGMLTVCAVSPSASPEQRQAFEQWDAYAHWRLRCAQRLKQACPQWRFQLAGQTSLDLFEAGADKSQALNHEGAGPLWFFADAAYPQGNDWTLAEALRARNDGSRVFLVRDWRHTWSLLQALVQELAPELAPEHAPCESGLDAALPCPLPAAA